MTARCHSDGRTLIVSGGLGMGNFRFGNSGVRAKGQTSNLFKSVMFREAKCVLNYPWRKRQGSMLYARPLKIAPTSLLTCLVPSN
jgi:hypothetical protein